MKIRILVGTQEKPLHADGRNYTAGQIADEADFMPGTLESMLNVGNAEKIPEPRQPEALRKDVPPTAPQQQPQQTQKK